MTAIIPESTNSYAERRAIEIADKVVPAFRAKGARHSCKGQVARCWQAAYDGALTASRQPTPAPAADAEVRDEKEPDEAVVDRCAKAMWECDEHTYSDRVWSGIPEYAQDLWRDRARACLITAAASPKAPAVAIGREGPVHDGIQHRPGCRGKAFCSCDAYEALEQAPAVAIGAGEVERLPVARVHEQIEEGGAWRACSGCQESVDGYVSERDYPYSKTFRCQPGGGCSECGGIGVIWEAPGYWDGLWDEPSTTDEAALAPASASIPADVEREALTAISKFVQAFRAPWGSWKTAWWEGEVSAYAACNPDNALMHVHNIAERALAARPSTGEKTS